MTDAPNVPFDYLTAIVTKRTDLVKFGAAPGGYIFRCYTCNGGGIGDKRSTRCELCAITRMEADKIYDDQYWDQIKGRQTD